jgi:hypothetical protein
MPKMTKAQARRRLMEAEAKFKKVYMAGGGPSGLGNWAGLVRTADMEAISKIVKRCIDRIR